MFDVIIAGAGPAGLSAALVLGRAQRTALVCDTAEPRNAPVRAMHGFLSRDGTAPADLRGISREQLARYPSVELRDIGIETARPLNGDGFAVELADHTTVETRRLLLATGVVDELPAIEGLAEHWGRGVFNCPYCDGWEHRDQPLAVLGGDVINIFLAVSLVRWSRDLVLCTDGATPDDGSLDLLSSRGIDVRETPVVGVEGSDEGLEHIVFADGSRLARRALFFHPPTRQRSDVPAQLGCTLLDDGSVQIDDLGRTDVPGVFAAGDMARRPTMPVAGAMVIIAAAEGAVAAVAIDQELLFQALG
jgi:thioredoxin reductase